jgi:hypothetical protein
VQCHESTSTGARRVPLAASFGSIQERCLIVIRHTLAAEKMQEMMGNIHQQNQVEA